MANVSQADPTRAVEARRTALAVSLGLAVYGGLFVLLLGRVRFENGWAAVAAWLAGYLLALTIHALSHVAARLLVRLGSAVGLVVRSLGSSIGLAIALSMMATATELPRFTGAAAFAGASLALLLSDEFPARVRNLLLVRDRLHVALGRRPRLRAGLLRSIRPLVVAGNLAPWLAVATLYGTLPPSLRERVGGYLLIIGYLSRLLLAQVLEEIVVLGFLELVALGDFAAAMRLPLSLTRLGAEIENASVDLEMPLAGYVAHGLNGPEGFPFTRAQTEGLVKRLLIGTRRSEGSDATSVSEPGTTSDAGGNVTARRQPPPGGAASPIAALLASGVRFSLGAVSADEEALDAALPVFAELRHGPARAILARRFPREPVWPLIARRYERDVRAYLFPVGLLWIVLPAVAWWLRDTPLWPAPLVIGALSVALMAWLVVYYAQWAFDESLRVRDFDYLAERLVKRVMLGELEEAMGSRDPRVRDLAIELLLFHDALVSQGFTAPAPGLRKFLKRV